TDGGEITNNGTLHVTAGSVGDLLKSSDQNGLLYDTGQLDIDDGVVFEAKLQTAVGSHIQIADGTELDLHASDIAGAVAIGAGARLHFLGTTDELSTFREESTVSGGSGSVVLLSGAAAVTFGGLSYDAATTDVDGCSLTFTSAPALKTLVLKGGKATFDAATSVAALAQSGGELTGAGTVTVSDFHWTGGIQSGTGTTKIPSTGFGLQIDGIAAKAVSHRTLEIASGAGGTWSRGTIDLTDGGEITNNGTLHVTA